MRTKERNYESYGIENPREVLDAIRRGGIDVRFMLLETIKEVYPDLPDQFYISIIFGKSYEQIERMFGLIPLHKNNFYGYRRKMIALMKEKIEKKA